MFFPELRHFMQDFGGFDVGKAWNETYADLLE
jgi:hypothetical protein